MDTIEAAQQRAEYWKAEHLAANEEIKRLRNAIIKILAHTSHTRPYPDELHLGLLKSIERIAHTALLPNALLCCERSESGE